jgi:hypothetical protein
MKKLTAFIELDAAIRGTNLSQPRKSGLTLSRQSGTITVRQVCQQW